MEDKHLKVLNPKDGEILTLCDGYIYDGDGRIVDPSSIIENK